MSAPFLCAHGCSGTGQLCTLALIALDRPAEARKELITSQEYVTKAAVIVQMEILFSELVLGS